MKNKIIGFFGIISNGLKVFSLNIKILVRKMKTKKEQEMATGLSTADENTDFLTLVKLLEESKIKLAESLKLFF